MSRIGCVLKGGCLCGAVRYQAEGEPLYAGFCYCEDCRRASGAGAIPSGDLIAGIVPGEWRDKAGAKTPALGAHIGAQFLPDVRQPSVRRRIRRQFPRHTIYASTLDDPSSFHPTHAVMLADRPHWAAVLDGLELHEGMPG